MTDRELITAVLRIQEFRGWSDPRLAAIAGIPRTTWFGAANPKHPRRLNAPTRARLQAFVDAWSDPTRKSPPPAHEVLVTTARAIQHRRGWNTSFCAGLSGIAWTTWQASVCDGTSSFLTKPVRAKLSEFVAAWSDDSRPAPDRNSLPVGLRFCQTKVTEAVRVAIVTSSKPHAAIGAELGLSLSTVYRVRLRERVMREAS